MRASPCLDVSRLLRDLLVHICIHAHQAKAPNKSVPRRPYTDRSTAVALEMATSKAVSPLAIALATSGAAISLSIYVWARLKSVELRLNKEVTEQRAAVLHLSKRLDVAMASPPVAPTRTSAAASAVVSQGTSTATESSLPVSRCSSTSTEHENSGYKTADEDAEDEAPPPPRMSAATSSAESPNRRPAAVKQPPPESAVLVEAPEASPPTPPTSPGWESRSIMAEGGSWSCIDNAAGSAAGSRSAGSRSAGSRSSAEVDAAKAAEAAVCEKADELYKARDFEEANDLLSGAEQSVEVQWRRCRICKERGEAAKLAGWTRAKRHNPNLLISLLIPPTVVAMCMRACNSPGLNLAHSLAWCPCPLPSGDDVKCKALLYEGLEHVTLALNHGVGGAQNAYVHKWYAIAVSNTSGYEGTKATIEKSLVVKEHFAKAAELNPLDATTRHALGLWYWEVASLSWAKRKLAAAVFASPPTGTYDEALSHFQLAEGISPGFYIRNRLMIAKCQLQLRDKAGAKKWAKLATELPITNHDDETAVAEARQME